MGDTLALWTPMGNPHSLEPRGQLLHVGAVLVVEEVT
jgi:hypothetical protein